jgi:phage terminase large subunit-like protein
VSGVRTLHEALEAVPKDQATLIAKLLATLGPRERRRLQYMWEAQARPKQMKPDLHAVGDNPHSREVKRDPSLPWYIWINMAGRGYGKTRVGSEYIRGEVEFAEKVLRKPIRCALVAPTAADCRDVMLEGDSGLLNVCPPWNRPKYESSKRKLTWKGGSVAFLYSAEEAERLRGPQHHVAWTDELAAWADPQGTWDMLMFGLRLVRRKDLPPQVCVTTTPKPRPPLIDSDGKRGIINQATTILTTGSTYENKDNLAPTFFDNVIQSYEGSRLGRQEIDGELLLDVMGALWSPKMIDTHRVAPSEVPPLLRLIVAIDPSVSEEERAATGIIAAGIAENGHVYVLEDQSLQGSPAEWARRAVATYIRLKADAIVAEVNNGGALVKEVLKTAMADKSLFKYEEVHASRGKITRAEPVSALYERGLVHHVGVFKALEDQMVGYAPAQAGKMLVDRMDALVWAVTKLAVRDVQSASRRGMFTRS